MSDSLQHHEPQHTRPPVHHQLQEFTQTHGEGDGNPLQYSCLKNPTDRGAWQAIVHRVAKSWTRLSNFTHTHMSIESVTPSSHLILCRTLLLLLSIFPALGSFQMSQLFASGGQNIGVSASTAVLPTNTQD